MSPQLVGKSELVTCTPALKVRIDTPHALGELGMSIGQGSSDPPHKVASSAPRLPPPAMGRAVFALQDPGASDCKHALVKGR